MHTRALANSARPASTTERDSAHTGSTPTSATASPSSQSRRRRSGLPALLAADALACSLTGTTHTRVDGASSCPAARSSRVTSATTSDVSRMPALSPTASQALAAASSNAPHSASARRSARPSVASSAQPMPLPPPGTPSQSPRRSEAVTARHSPAGFSPVDRESEAQGHRTTPAQTPPARTSAAPSGRGSSLHTPVAMGSPLPSRLPAMLQPSKLSASGAGTGANTLSPTSTPTSLQPQTPTQQQQQQRQRRPASTATMTTAPSSPARVASRPDVTQLTVTSPARRCLLMTETTDPVAQSEVPPTSQHSIPPPPPPLPPSPASASASAAAASARPSSTSGVTLARGGAGRSASAHHREGGRVRSATTVGANAAAGMSATVPGAPGADAYLRENPRVRTLVNNLYQHVLTTQPEQPLRYLAQLPADTAGQFSPPAREALANTPHGDDRRSSSSASRLSTRPQQGTAQTQPAVTQQQQQTSSSSAGRTRARRLPPAATPPQQSITAASRRDTEDAMRSTNSAAPASARPQSSPPSREAQQQQSQHANVHASGGARRRSSLESDVLRSDAGGEAAGSRRSSMNVPDSGAVDTEARQPLTLLRTPPLAPSSSSSPGAALALGGVAFARSGLAMPPSLGMATTTTTTVTSAAHASGALTSSASSKHGSPALLAQRIGLASAASHASSGAANHATGGNLGLLLRSGSSVFRGAGQHSAASFVGSASGLERGEGTQSDLSSVLSTNSVDLQEFLTEFRMAKEEICGSGVDRPAITLDELAQVIESSSFPCPDAEVLLDLFDELQPCARYLAGTLIPSSPQLPASNAVAVTSLLKRNTSSPAPQRLGLASAMRNSSGRDMAFHLGANMPPRGAAATQSLGSLSSVSSLNGVVMQLEGNAAAAAAAAGLGSSGKSRAGAAAAALYGTANMSGNGWGGQLRTPSNESCVTAAHPPSSYATNTQGHLADMAQQQRQSQQQQPYGQQTGSPGGACEGGRSEGKAAAAAMDNRIGSEGHRDGYPFQNTNAYQRGGSDVFNNSSPLQSHGGAPRPFSAAVVGLADGDESFPTVPFDTLLARMAYKIQGRYPSEALRIAFFGMVVDDESVPGGSVNMAALESSGRGMRGAISSDSLAPSEPVGMSDVSAGTGGGGGYGALPSCTVPLRRCIAEGLFARLGMVDVTTSEVQRGLRNAGLPTNQDDQRSWECHLEDFVRLVRAVTAAVERGTTGVSPANLFLTSLRESYLQRGGHAGGPSSASWKEDPASGAAAPAPAPSSATGAASNPAAFSGLC